MTKLATAGGPPLPNGRIPPTFGRARTWRAPIAGAALLSVCAAAFAARPSEAVVQPHAPAVPAARAAVPAEAPKSAAQRGTVELTLTALDDEAVRALLKRAGVAPNDIAAAAGLIEEAGLRPLAAGTEAIVMLGDKAAAGQRKLEQLTISPSPGLVVEIARALDGRLELTTRSTTLDAAPKRYRGQVGSGLFWSLRSAGVPAEAAREYLEALAARMDLRGLKPADRFDLVVDHRKTAGGADSAGPLLYAGIGRPNGGQLHLVRWAVAGSEGWFEPGKPRQRSGGLMRPVDGRLTSRFGYRVHPILGIARAHNGVDFGAASGTPVFAAADGIVGSAGWAGGYGRQVKLVHPDGLSTSYSHLSRIAAEPGSRVRRGELIGFVGSSGFSTGPHLHYEVSQHGRRVDPLSVQFAAAVSLDRADLAAIEARVRQLRAI